MREVIVVNGAAECGKDSFVDSICELLGLNGYKTFKASSINPVKMAMAEFFGWDGMSKEEEDRQAMCNIKAAWDRYGDGSTGYCMGVIRRAFNNKFHPDIVVFIDIREPTNIRKLVDRFHATYPKGYASISTLLVTTKRCIPSYSNLADISVDNFNYDHVITNDGTPEDLKHKAFGFAGVNFLLHGGAESVTDHGNESGGSCN